MEDVRNILVTEPVPTSLNRKEPVESKKLRQKRESVSQQLPIEKSAAKAPRPSTSPELFAFASTASAEPKVSTRAWIFPTNAYASFVSSLDKRVRVAGGVAALIFSAVFFGYLFSGDEKQDATVEMPRQVETTVPSVRVEPEVQTVVQSAEPVADVPPAFDPKAYEAIAEREVATAKVKRDEPAQKAATDRPVDAKPSPTKTSSNFVTSSSSISSIKPSTLVISAKNGRVDKRIESPDATPARRTSTSQSNAAGATRPRIVANPKP
jgi:hypothetical protein